MLETVENKFADIDFTKYQYLHAGTTGAAETAGAGRGRIVPVKPVPTAVVGNWRHLESYECDGDNCYSEEQFLMLHSRATVRQLFLFLLPLPLLIMYAVEVSLS